MLQSGDSSVRPQSARVPRSRTLHSPGQPQLQQQRAEDPRHYPLPEAGVPLLQRQRDRRPEYRELPEPQKVDCSNNQLSDSTEEALAQWGEASSERELAI